ncbi:MAG: hypothetical protein ACFB50_01665 [Rubrobacteraceae bacterium]
MHEYDLGAASAEWPPWSRGAGAADRDELEDRLYRAHTLGWKPVAANPIDEGSSLIVLHGEPTVRAGFSYGLPRYTLTFLEIGYELFDKERDVLALARRLPAPVQAAGLLYEHGVATSEALRLEVPRMLFVPEDDESA